MQMNIPLDQLAQLDQLCREYDTAVDALIEDVARQRDKFSREESASITTFALVLGCGDDAQKIAGIAAMALIRLVEMKKEQT